MIYKPRGNKTYVLDFWFRGKRIARRTKATNQNLAKSIEGQIRAELERGNWDILQKPPSPALKDFLVKAFLPHVDRTAKAGTARYYHDGAKRLLASDLADLLLEKITGEHTGIFEARFSHLSASSINCSLRTLRRALSLAVEWKKLESKPEIKLASGERKRDRVLSDDEAARYILVCSQPWRDVATLMLGTGMRPGECYALRWEQAQFNGQGGIIQITQGKTDAARRSLPMVEAVSQALKARHEAQGSPREGWVFPTGSESGHIEESSAKQWHAKALEILAKAHKEKPEECAEIRPFQPYCLRHTALTRLAEAGCDAFTLARIAGHESIAMTKRYVHPQADAIERAFAKAHSQESPNKIPNRRFRRIAPKTGSK